MTTRVGSEGGDVQGTMPPCRGQNGRSRAGKKPRSELYTPRDLPVGILQPPFRPMTSCGCVICHDVWVWYARGWRGAQRTCDVHDLQIGRVGGGRLPQVAQPVVALVGDGDAALIRLDGTERKVFRRCRHVAEHVEGRGLADVREADDAHLEILLDAPEAGGCVRGSQPLCIHLHTRP